MKKKKNYVYLICDTYDIFSGGTKFSPIGVATSIEKAKEMRLKYIKEKNYQDLKNDTDCGVIINKFEIDTLYVDDITNATPAFFVTKFPYCD